MEVLALRLPLRSLRPRPRVHGAWTQLRVGSVDQEVMDGLSNVLAKMCLQDVIANDPDQENKWRTYTIEHPEMV